MDHYATRYPTNVVDIASFLLRLSGTPHFIARRIFIYLTFEPPAINNLPPIIHFSAPEPFTKYEICLVFSKVLSLEHSHIIYDAEPPKGEGATTRPKDTKLDTSETEKLMPDGSLGCGGFEEWWTEYLDAKR
jgi:S-adenosylmethionine synthetase